MGIYSLHYFLSGSLLKLFIEVHVKKKNHQNQFSRDRLYVINNDKCDFNTELLENLQRQSVSEFMITKESLSCFDLFESLAIVVIHIFINKFQASAIQNLTNNII